MRIVFLHGLLDGAAAWADTMAAMGESADELVAIDLADMGTRMTASGPVNLTRFAADVATTLDTLDGPVLLVGHSMGAQVAELAAALRPDQVVGLALIAPAPLSGARIPADQPAPFLSPAGSRPSAFLGPVLILLGAEDPFVTRDVIDTGVLPRFTEARLAVVTRAGHWPHIEQPQALAAMLNAFVTLAQDGSAVGRRPQDDDSSHTPENSWRDAFASTSAGGFAAALAPDVTLHASTLLTPIRGRDEVSHVMAKASGIYERLEFTHRAQAGDRTYLEWRAEAFGGIELAGITVLAHDGDGRIVEAAIHHRPLDAALRFSAALRDLVRPAIDGGHFFQGELPTETKDG